MEPAHNRALLPLHANLRKRKLIGMLTMIFWITFGCLVGWTASILRGERSLKRITSYILVGMVGGLLGGYCGVLLGAEALEYNASATGMMFAVFGAVTFVILAGFATDKRY
jgi:uncharacterized membrane protein YeaQ/YmgE (transglycosylase-associated protein family)